MRYDEPRLVWTKNHDLVQRKLALVLPGMYRGGANPGPGRPPGRDGHRAVRPPEPPCGPNGGSAVRNDYHAAQMMQLQMLHMRLMCSS